jgi:hypothetical protein
MKMTGVLLTEWHLSDFTLVAISKKGCVVARENTTGIITFFMRSVFNAFLREGVMLGRVIPNEGVLSGPRQEKSQTFQRLIMF